MTRVQVVCGACGFTAEIRVAAKGAAEVAVQVSSDCEAAVRWGETVRRLEWRGPLGRMPAAGEYWHSAWKILKHRTCPLPLALLKAVEVEIGAAVAADVAIRFLPVYPPSAAP